MAKKPLVNNARLALNQMKEEIGRELGITPSKDFYNGNVSSRDNGSLGGSLGGHMTKRLVEMAQKSLIDNKEK